MERDQVKKVIETLLYMTDHPLSAKEILDVLEAKTLSEGDVKELLQGIKEDFEAAGSGLCLIEVAGGAQVATRPEMAAYIRRMYRERLTTRLSASALETLSIVAYKQPISRSEIEQIRGVEATGVLDTLLERRMVKVVGRKETIGRPLLYGTTTEFLRQFGLNHLSDLPDLQTLPVEEMSTPLPGGDPGPGEEPGGGGSENEEMAPEDVAEAPQEEKLEPDPVSSGG